MAALINCQLLTEGEFLQSQTMTVFESGFCKNGQYRPCSRAN